MRALIGDDKTFQCLFVNDDGSTFTPISPTITVFHYLGTTKTLLVDADVLSPASPVETGRYAYTYTVPDTFEDGDTLFVELVGEHPSTSDTHRFEVTVDLTVPNRVPGLSTRFIP